MNNSIQELKSLPKEIQEKVAKMVSGGFGYPTSKVEYENGKYEVSSFSCIRKWYANDHKVWWFDKETVMKDKDLRKIVEKEDNDFELWLKNEGKNFDWESFAQ